jgi:hypothetical protein
MVPHGDQSIDVSYAAQGALSSSPLSGTSPHQTIQYIFFGIDGKDLLIKMLKSPNCIDGCKLVSMRPNNNQTQFRKGTLYSRIHRHSLVQQQKNYRGVLRRQHLL